MPVRSSNRRAIEVASAVETSNYKSPGTEDPAPCAAILLLDLAGRILSVQGDRWSEDGLDTTGWPARQLQSLVAADDRDQLVTALNGAASGQLSTISLGFEQRPRSRYWLHIAPATGTNPITVIAAVSSGMVAAEVREIERQRASAEHMFRQGFDNSPVGMLLAEPEGGTCVRVNDALCRFLGRSREQVLGMRITAVTPAEDHPAIQQARADVVSGTLNSFEGEQRFILPDARVVWGILHLTAIRGVDGLLEAFHVQVMDITERKQREVRQAHDIEDALWLGRIRAALDEDRFVLYAQPIVDLTTGKTVQHELLLRMLEEDGTVIAPGLFLPTAERYGLISEIDRWVIRQAVKFAGDGSPAEFNLSARSLGDPTVLSELSTAVRESGVDPSLLVVEVTETAFAGHPEIGRRFAEQVTELGCRLALDDFGTGFSSLSYLKHLPAEHLKIDIEFVRDLATSETDARVVRGIVGLAREFEQTTIAEGVEDERTLLVLKDLGVDLAQGYLFGQPSPCTEIPRASVRLPKHEPAASKAIQVVQDVFAKFAERDVEAMILHYRPDAVLRPFATAELANRPEPYCGHEGLRTYMRDVERVWDELTLEPLTYRQSATSVIAFGRAEGRSGDHQVIAGIVWVVRFDGELVATVDVFQAVGGTPALTNDQLARLRATPALPR